MRIYLKILMKVKLNCHVFSKPSHSFAFESVHWMVVYKVCCIIDQKHSTITTTAKITNFMLIKYDKYSQTYKKYTLTSLVVVEYCLRFQSPMSYPPLGHHSPYSNSQHLRGEATTSLKKLKKAPFSPHIFLYVKKNVNNRTHGV